jgi:hypothetical protein
MYRDRIPVKVDTIDKLKQHGANFVKRPVCKDIFKGFHALLQRGGVWRGVGGL